MGVIPKGTLNQFAKDLGVPREIGEAARLELTELLGRKVHLFLHVKVEENWAENREIYEEIGLDFGR